MLSAASMIIAFPVAVGCWHQVTFTSRVGEDGFLRTALHETDKSCDNTVFGLRWHTLETRYMQYLRIDFATEGADDAEAGLFNGSNRNCFHGGICLVPHCARALPSKHRNVNQSDRYDNELQRLASGRAVGSDLAVLRLLSPLPNLKALAIVGPFSFRNNPFFAALTHIGVYGSSAPTPSS